jgi:hypothetical protein
MKTNNIKKSYLYFHTGKAYDNIILLNYLDKEKY